jgi:hypothetical protein
MRRAAAKASAYLLCLLLAATAACLAEDPSHPCFAIQGRAHLFSGDGLLRIWHVGTHHEYTPDARSWHRVEGWLEEGAGMQGRGLASPASKVFLLGTFVVCPTEPFKQGSVQEAYIQSVSKRLYKAVR